MLVHENRTSLAAIDCTQYNSRYQQQVERTGSIPVHVFHLETTNSQAVHQTHTNSNGVSRPELAIITQSSSNYTAVTFNSVYIR